MMEGDGIPRVLAEARGVASDGPSGEREVRRWLWSMTVVVFVAHQIARNALGNAGFELAWPGWMGTEHQRYHERLEAVVGAQGTRPAMA
jgi:hypothetical protein